MSQTQQAHQTQQHQQAQPHTSTTQGRATQLYQRGRGNRNYNTSRNYERQPQRTVYSGQLHQPTFQNSRYQQNQVRYNNNSGPNTFGQIPSSQLATLQGAGLQHHNQQPYALFNAAALEENNSGLLPAPHVDNQQIQLQTIPAGRGSAAAWSSAGISTSNGHAIESNGIDMGGTQSETVPFLQQQQQQQQHQLQLQQFPFQAMHYGYQNYNQQQQQQFIPGQAQLPTPGYYMAAPNQSYGNSAQNYGLSQQPFMQMPQISYSGQYGAYPFMPFVPQAQILCSKCQGPVDNVSTAAESSTTLHERLEPNVE